MRTLDCLGAMALSWVREQMISQMRQPVHKLGMVLIIAVFVEKEPQQNFGRQFIKFQIRISNLETNPKFEFSKKLYSPLP